MMKDSSKRQVLVFMSLENSNKFMVLSYKYITNINRALKDINLDVIADFIQANYRRLTIITNKVTSILDLNIIDSDNIIIPRLSQSKSYFKILGILYLIEDTNIPISSDIIERILQSIYIFNNVILTSKLRVIKASPKLDIAIIWIDIQNAQSNSKAKSLINRCFNIGNLITTVQGTKINLEVS